MDGQNKPDEGSKKGPFEHLDRADLIKKCKGLLALAKNAKQTKDEYVEENLKLKQSLENYEKQKIADKECLKAMQEVVDSLTGQKLSATTQINNLECSVSSLKKQLEASNKQMECHQNILIENESMKRQINRLTDENDELMTELQNLEKQILTVNDLSVQPNKELIMIEEANLKCKNLEEMLDDLNYKYKDLQKENDELKIKCFDQNDTNDIDEFVSKTQQLTLELNNTNAEIFEKNEMILKLEEENVKLSQIDEEFSHTKNTLNFVSEKYEILTNKLETLSKRCNVQSNEFKTKQDRNDLIENQVKNQTKKLNLYKTKLLEFSAKLKQLKACKDILSTTVGEYSQSVSKWQMEILTVSNQLFDKIRCLKQEKSELLNKITNIEAENNRKNQQLCDLEKQLADANADLLILTDNVMFYKNFETKYEELSHNYANILKKVDDQNSLIKKFNENNIQNVYQEELQASNILLNEKLNDYSIQTDSLEKGNYKLLNEIENLKAQLSDVELGREELKYKLGLNESSLKEVSDKNSTLLNQYEEVLIEISKKSSIIEEINITISNMKLESEQKTIELTKLSNELMLKEQSMDDCIIKKEQQIQSKTKEIEELLVEMREINEALKNRGDVISKQKDKINDYEADITMHLNRISELELLCETKDVEIKKITATVSDLEKSNATNDTHSELVSTSSISRIEEISRMRDIEDSFEEKYNKLRALAVKLKKKVGEQAAIITKLESKNNQNCDEGVQITSKLGAIEVQVRNLQLLQSENDRLQDVIEVLTEDKNKAEVMLNELKENLERVSIELKVLKDSNEVNKNSTIESNKQKASLDQIIKEYVKQINSLKEENVNHNILKKEMENEIEKLKSNYNSKEKEINALKEEENKLKAELAKVKSSVKKNNVLNLEMDAYEKSLNEISQKLESKNAQVNELESAMNVNKSTVEALKNQIRILEESIECEKIHSIDLKQQLDLNQHKLKEYDYDKTELKIKLDELTKENNTIKLELEGFRLETAQNASEKEKMIRILQSENEQNIRQICVINNELSSLKVNLREAEQELVDVKTEFASYKVRAQSVLRQSQTKETSREKELEEELSSAYSSNDSLTAKLNTSVDQNKQLHTNYEEAKQDKERLQLRCKELLQLLEESRSHNETIHDEIRKQKLDHQEVLKAQRLQIETLNNCYKKQTAELIDKYNKEIEEFKKIQNQYIEENKHSTTNIESTKGHPFKMLSTDEQKIDWIMMERQEGEGSENTNSGYNFQRKISTTRIRRDFIPLDELLNSSFEDNAAMVDGNVSPSIELQSTKERLLVQESRVKHLSALLAEAEQDLAKLTQLNDVLKEEVRRQERSTEREKHLHNLEYLKNVIFKFLTINCGDEKSHLVPVLNTILKLSPEETQKLQMFAKGGDGNQKGWGSYLPVWSNSNP